MKKTSFPLSDVRKYLEPGPVVLVSSRRGREKNIMTLGWQTVIAFYPSLVACMISSGNHSFDLIRDSGECVLNLPTTALTDAVAGIGNCSGADTDKFKKFGLKAEKAEKVKAPLIRECHANFECVLHDDALADSYNLFIFEVVAAHVLPEPEYPETLHYTGDGIFRVPCGLIDRHELFTKVS